MKTLLKSLLVWLMLLAIPFQGFASATMLFCAPIQPAALVKVVAAAPHDHHAMLAAEHEEHGHHADSKCNSCSTCCFGATMVPSHATRIPVETQQFAPAPRDDGYAPTVDLALPERPPQASPT